MTIPDQQKVHEVVKEAQGEGGGVVGKNFPEVKTSNFPPDVTIEFDAACEKVVRWWLIWNYPEVGGQTE